MRSSLIAKGLVYSALTLSVVAGCRSSGGKGGGGVLRAGIPPQAQVAQEGTGQLVFVAEQTGRAYLYDRSSDRLIETYQMRQGQRLAVDAKAGRATLAGNEVAVGKLRGGNAYQVYFLAD